MRTGAQSPIITTNRQEIIYLELSGSADCRGLIPPMAPPLLSSSSLLLLLLLVPVFSSAQQGYLNNKQNDCYGTNSSTTLGYTCTPSTSPSSCTSFLTFRTTSIYTSPALVSFLLNVPASNISSINNLSSPVSPLPPGQLLLVPTTCSCTSGFYQHNTSFSVTPTDDTYLLIANDTYGGLSTCQALISQNPKFDSRNLLTGDDLLVPLRCACPTANQTRSGAKFLLTYVVTFGDDVPTIASRFNADYQAVLDANGLSSASVIYPFTTLLLPISTVPTVNETLSPPPPAATPPTASTSPTAKTKSSKKWVIVGIGIGVAVLLLSAVSLFFCCIRRRRQPISTREDTERLQPMEQPRPEESINSEIRRAVETLAVYKYQELERSTGGFDDEHRMKGAVYRANFNGDAAVIKSLKGDVSAEINVLRRINHSSIIRLSGFCVHEGSTYLVYEFAENGSLSDWIHGKSCLTWNQRIQIACDVADGLNYLHNYSNPTYVHKDLKSSNILLDGEFRAKVSSFELARSVEVEDGEMQLTRHVVGTQGYMAPEYLEHGLISNKMDVFAFGVVMLELLSGKEATFAKDGEAKEKGEVLLWTTIEPILSGEDVQSKLRGFIDPCMKNDYPFDLAFAVADLARRCVTRDLGSRPAVAEVLMSLSAIYNSTLDWDPSDLASSGSMASYGR